MEEESFVLLSSMSPKLCKTTPKKIKTPSKLALKRNIRRSSICDKYQRTIPQKDIVAVDIISTSSASTNSTENSNKSVNKYEICKVVLSNDKKESINNWLNDLPLTNSSNEIDHHNSFFENISCIDGILKDNGCGKIFNSTRLENSKQHSKPFIKPVLIKDEIPEANKIEVVDLVSDTSESEENIKNDYNYNCTIEIIEQSFDENKENLCDNIEKLNKINCEASTKDKSLQITSRKSSDLIQDNISHGQDELFSSKNVTKTPKSETKRESITYKNPYLELDDPKNALKTKQTNHIKKKFESPWMERLKSLCDSDSDINKSPNKTNSTKKDLKNKSPIPGDDDVQEKEDKDSVFDKDLLKTPCNKDELALLYELYGEVLSTRKDLFLQKTEPKKETKRRKMKLPNTEKKPNKCSTKLNPSSEKPVKKSRERKKNLPRVALDYSDDDEENYKKDENKTNNCNDYDGKKFKDNISDKFTKFRSKNDDDYEQRKLKKLLQPSCKFDNSSDDELGSCFKPNTLSERKKLSNGKSSSWESGTESSDEFGCNKRPLDKLYLDMIEKKKINDSQNTSPYFKKDKGNKELSKMTPLNKNKSEKLKKAITSRKTYTFLESLSKHVPIEQCDITVRLFRNNFKEHRDKLYKKLFDLFNDEIFDKCMAIDTPYEWNDRMTSTGGYCACKKITRSSGKIERSVRFVLSSKVIDSADRLRDTLVHEMCHAATWLVNQISDGHGSYWKAWASKAMKTFPELPPIKRCHDYSITTKYTYKCEDCGYSFGRHSKSLDLNRKRCGYCRGVFKILINKQKKNGEIQSVPITPKKEPTGFALFVKENYAKHKHQSRSHAEVMKALSEKFALTKI